MPSFQYDTNYARERAFEKVRFGAKSPILEVELNEMQDILRNLIRNHMQVLFASGVDASLILTNTDYDNTFRIDAFWAWVGGRHVYVSGTDNGAHLSVADGHNYFDAGAPPVSGSRTDLVFLEVWEGEVKPGEGIYKWGTQNSGQTLTNNLLDSRIGQETTWRHQIMNEIRVAPGITSILNAIDKTGAAVSDLGNGLYGNQDTGHYLIPLLLVPRTAGVTTINTSTIEPVYVTASLRGDVVLGASLATGVQVDAVYADPAGSPTQTNVSGVPVISFAADQNQSVSFSRLWGAHSDVEIELGYLMSADNAGDVKLGISYAVNGGAFTDLTEIITPGAGTSYRRATLSSKIPSSALPSGDNLLTVKVSRLGADATDTHTGNFQLASLRLL